MNLYFPAGLILLVSSCVVAFLASKNQNWLDTALPAPAARRLSLLLLCLAVAALAQVCLPLTCLFVILTTGMLTWIACPCLAAVRAIGSVGS